MTLYKKKKNQSILYFNLNAAKEEAQQNNKNYFYYSLLPEEHDKAFTWAQSNNILFEISHKTGNSIFYKFTFL